MNVPSFVEAHGNVKELANPKQTSKHFRASPIPNKRGCIIGSCERLDGQMKRKITVEEYHHPTPGGMIMSRKYGDRMSMYRKSSNQKANSSYTICSVF
eukprot:scaffold584_cov338-Pavlova_lutheri.AAC.37